MERLNCVKKRKRNKIKEKFESIENVETSSREAIRGGDILCALKSFKLD